MVRFPSPFPAGTKIPVGVGLLPDGAFTAAWDACGAWLDRSQRPFLSSKSTVFAVHWRWRQWLVDLISLAVTDHWVHVATSGNKTRRLPFLGKDRFVLVSRSRWWWTDDGMRWMVRSEIGRKRSRVDGFVMRSHVVSVVASIARCWLFLEACFRILGKPNWAGPSNLAFGDLSMLILLRQGSIAIR